MTDTFYVYITDKPLARCTVDPFKVKKEYEREVRAGMIRWEDMSES